MEIRKLVGMNVRRLRHQRNWSQERLGFEAGLHRTYISQVERGVINASVTTIEALAITLDVRPAALFANWQKPTQTSSSPVTR